MKTPIEDRIAATMKKVREGDPTFWRQPLANATIALLERGAPVTVETLIAELEKTGEGPDVELRRGVSEAAIDRLRKLVVKHDRE